jgi:hypothetical protein
MERVALVAMLLAACATAASAASPKITWDKATGRVTVTNGRLELTVETKDGLNPCLLRDAATGCAYADGDYAWPDGAFPALIAEPTVTRLRDGTRVIAFRARLGALEICQTFSAPLDDPGVILESITIENPGRESLATADFRCGFTKAVRKGDEWLPEAAALTLCPVPYRRETNGQMQEWPLTEVAQHGSGFAGWAEPWHETPTWGAEGWVWSSADSAFLIAKYNAGSMEWSLLDPVARGADTVLRFAGAGQWKHGHPEGATTVAPGGSYAYGETRLQAVDGNWQRAYSAYRRYTESKGCVTPAGYNPPVHWNELYDNEYYFRCCDLCGRMLNDERTAIKPEFWPLNEELLKQYYSRDLMLAEAAKAKDLGCEALYMDPGWDAGPNSQAWGEDRLGPSDEWVARMKGEFGLKVSLWCALGCVPPSYGDPNTCGPEALVMGEDGKPTELVCFSSPAFLATKEKRLLELCESGVSFLMFDSDQFSGPCWDATHGHHIPSTREDHASALIELSQRLRSKYPNLLIELHDPISGPSGIHYTPTYYGYARKSSFTDLWGHEFMWGPLDDILSRRAVSLYYYNLAYSIPLYLHVNLKQDNENSLIFWWFASTCRHLGVGGKPDEPVWAAEKRAMATYKSLKTFYTQGAFYGLDETVHVHTLADRGEAVINAFDLDDQPVTRSVRFRLSDIGLRPGKVTVEGAPSTVTGDEVTLDLSIPARGHCLVKIASR